MDLARMVDQNVPVVMAETNTVELRKVAVESGCMFMVVQRHEGEICGYISVQDLPVKNVTDLTATQIIKTDFILAEHSTQISSIIEKSGDSSSFPMVILVAQGKVKGVLSPTALIKGLNNNLEYTVGILNTLDSGIMAIDEDETIRLLNKKFRAIHSLKGKREGENVFVHFPESLITIPLRNPESQLVYGPIRFHKSGVTVVPTYKPIKDRHDCLIGSVAIVKEYIDDADTRINVKEITSLNNLFSSIFRNLTDMVFCMDLNHFIFYANPAFISLFKKNPGEVIDNPDILRLFSGRSLSANVEKSEKECTLKSGRGKTIHARATIFPISNLNNITEGAVIILKDITHEKSLTAEIELKSSLLQYFKQQANKVPKEMICLSPEFQQTVSAALKAAKSTASVLIEGENGVGKEMLARLIHSNSDRNNRVFIPVNCGAIPEHLWESEMFGYEEGAFTGAKKGGKMGILEMADGGTVLLDEISELSPPAQVKILRFLQNMEISKIGMKSVKKVDVRIIAATNKTLDQLVHEGSFRMDLFYRLNVVRLRVPPLRDRKEEIIPLARNFVSIFNDKYGKSVSLPSEVEPIFLQQSWPGNIRQLKNVIEHGVVMCDDEIRTYHLPLHMSDEHLDDNEENSNHTAPGYNLNKSIQELEKQKIVDAIKSAQGNRSKAIALLGISRKTFYKRLREYDIFS